VFEFSCSCGSTGSGIFITTSLRKSNCSVFIIVFLLSKEREGRRERKSEIKLITLHDHKFNAGLDSTRQFSK